MHANAASGILKRHTGQVLSLQLQTHKPVVSSDQQSSPGFNLQTWIIAYVLQRHP